MRHYKEYYLNFMVGLSIALIMWAAYVYTGRFELMAFIAGFFFALVVVVGVNLIRK